MSEWQPIETAPKDGTFVLVYARMPSRRKALAAWQGSGDEAEWYGVDDWGLKFASVSHGEQVTHWMPLPKPPEASA